MGRDLVVMNKNPGNAMLIELIDENSPHLAKVKDLGRRNRKTLGFFPDGAFEEHAAKGGLLIARSERGDVLGYLLFRVVWRGGVWPIAVIVHLCIGDEHRNKGIAKELVNELCRIAKDSFLRLELNCRRDYEANAVWPKIGFVYKGEVLSPGGKPLLRWEMLFRQLPLMAVLEQKATQKGFRAVLDTNVVFRLQDPVSQENENERILSEEAKALQENWLIEDVGLFITDETFNEIQRNDKPAERTRRFSYAQQFDNLTTNVEAIRDVYKCLTLLFPVTLRGSIQSDIRQLAYAIAGNAHFFITQDTGLLKKSDVVHSNFSIRVLSPGEFISRIDEVIREVEYQPDRLGGSRALQISKAHSDQLILLFPIFGGTKSEERRSHFDSRLRHFVAQPNRYHIELCMQKDSRPLAMIVYDRSNPPELGVPMIRASRSPLTGTILRYLLRRAILISTRESRPFVCVNDNQESVDFAQAMEECGFTRIGERWVKCSLQGADSSSNLSTRFNELRIHFPSIHPLLDSLKTALSSAIEKQDPLALADLERRLWPGKILDSDIPCYIIPIKAIWAQHLFDEDIARQTLWGSREKLLLGNENVYYRSKRSSWKISSPARVLWYVTRDRNHPFSSMHIRACSAINEVTIGRAKDLFRRFRRLGVYEWRDVLRTAKGDGNNYIMALRFSNTELLSQPIDLMTLKEILNREEGKAPVLQSPQRIFPRTFASIYQAAVRHNGGNQC
jgi:predicted nucleic acid-binding protein/GNAT superfamily N-acetyltransferase